MRILKIFKKHIKKNKKGFTLIELIVNMAIIGIIMAMVTTLTGNTINMFNRKKDNLEAMAVADLVCNTVENQIRMANAVKLENEFEEVLKVKDVQDQTNDGLPDYMVSRKSENPDAEQYFFDFPICLDEIKNYSSIFLLPDDGSKSRHVQRKQLKGAARSGKLYVIDRTKDAKGTPQTTNSGTEFLELTDALGQKIKIYPLISDDYYKGYNVDVYFEYLFVQPTDPDNYKPDSSKVNSIKVYVDVYDENKLAYSKESTITFNQINFGFDKPRNTAKLTDNNKIKEIISGKKEVLLYR